jgi:hypothetical protein
VRAATLPTFLTVASLVFSSAGCRRAEPERVDKSKLETPATEAVLRRVAADAEEALSRAKIGIIVLGEQLEDSSSGFREKFSNLGIPLVTSSRMTQVWVGPIARVVDRETKFQPLQFQITSVEPRADGPQEVIAAWAFEDRMERRRYLAKPDANGTWTVEPLEVIAKKP